MTPALLSSFPRSAWERARWTLCVLPLLFAAIPVAAADLATSLRRPIAFAQSTDGKSLYVANRDSGTISVIDLATNQVVAEHAIGQRLSDLTPIPNTTLLLAADESAHVLLLLDAQASSIKVLQRLPISPYPVSILLSPDGRQVTIASLWSRRLTFVSIGDQLTAGKVIDLPFAPRCQIILPGRDRLLVADSFGGQLAILDPSTQSLRETRSLPAHNIRGLGVSHSAVGRGSPDPAPQTPVGRESPDSAPQMLVVSHQMLNDLAHSIRNDIHWGLLMSNDLRWLKVDSLLAGGQSLYHGAHMHPLGDSGKGGGDPGGLDIAPDGTVVVALSGVSEVAFGKEGDFSMQRLRVPRRPTAIKIGRLPLPLGAGRGEGFVAFIASTLADSVSILDLDQRKIVSTISLGPSPELTLPERGELLFHDAKLSHDGWMSCQSCHTDGHTSHQMNDNFSDRSFGAPKRVLSLLGVKDTLPLAWNGQVQTLAQQIHNSVASTMQRDDKLPDADVQAIAAYVETLALPPSLDALRGTQDRAAIERGRLVFERHDCASCHAPPTYTSPATYDVGLRDAQGVTEFNPPSLRGLSHRGPYFHDNSAASLSDVFLRRGHPSGSSYSASEVRDLVAFLLSL